MENNPVQLLPPPQVEGKVKKARKHVARHKKKYSLASALALVVALLEVWPTLCPLLPTALNVQCKDTRPLAELGKTKLEELKDAGF